MTSIMSLLVGTDFSVEGNNAVRRAALLAQQHGARLHILHVVNAAGYKPWRDWFCPPVGFDTLTAQAQRALQRMAVEVTATYSLTPTVEILVGDPFETLLQASDRADMVVLGRRDRSRLGGWLAGRAAERVIGNIERPVLVVRTPVKQPYRRVLVPMDFSASSDAAIRVAAQMRREAILQVFHALSSHRETLLRDADVPEHIVRETRLMEEAGTSARMRRKVTGLGLDCTLMGFVLAYGTAVKSTLRHARQVSADLIVVGKKGPSAAGGFLFGGVSRRMLSEAACDMLIVPRPQESSPSQLTATVSPRLKLAARADNASLAQITAAHAEVLTPGHWIHNKARFMPRRTA